MRAIRTLAFAVAVLSLHGTAQAPKEQSSPRTKAVTTRGQVSAAKIAEIKQSMKAMYADAWKEGDDVQVTLASGGDSARGIILKEDKGELSLDTKPCGGLVVMYTKPYKKRQVGEITCESKKYPRYEVEQK